MCDRATGIGRFRIASALLLTLVFGRAAAVTISNTAIVDFTDGMTPGSATSNTVTLETVPEPSASAVSFLRYAPGAPGSITTPADGGACRNTAGVFAPIPSVTDSSGAVIDTTVAPLEDASAYQLGEAVFVRLADANRNLDPLVRDLIDLRLTSDNGDEEVLRLRETGIDTGVFAAAIQSAPTPPAVVRFDCRFSVMQGATLLADYVDELFPADTASDSAVVDSASFVFDSTTGLPVDGVSVTLIDVASGLPATVFGIDGTSGYPSTVTSGTTVADASGRLYDPPPGGFRFPSVAPGNYRLQVVAPTGYAAPSIVPLAVLQALRDPAGNPYVLGPGSLGDPFARTGAPDFRIDYAVDPIQSGLVLQKRASTSQVAAGEFLQYRLTLRNLSTVGAVTDVRVVDTLPAGLRYEPGSLRIAGQGAPDPSFSADGRTLTIEVGLLAAGSQIEISYLVQVGAGARTGEVINRAIASGGGGGIVSNEALAAVHIREPFFTSRFTIIGRVVEGECGATAESLQGVPEVRMMLDDGTYVPTDGDGQFHFEGVRPGTHVVQLDLDSLPADLEAIACTDNSRFAGRSFSQFVEAQGGSLWRTDFHLRRRSGEVGVRLSSAYAADEGRLAFRVELDGGRVAIRNLVATVQLPEGVSYVAASLRVDGAAAPDPETADGFVSVRLGDAGRDWRRVIEFQGLAPRVPVGGGMREFTLRAQFDSGLASLRPEGAAAVEELIAELRGTRVQRIAVVGHTDSERLTAASEKIFRDNHVLSEARAGTVAALLAAGLGLPAGQVSTEGRGPDQPIAGNDTRDGMARNRRVEVIVFSELAATTTRMDCAPDGFIANAMASFATDARSGLRTPLAESRLACSAAAAAPVAQGERASITVTGAGVLPAAGAEESRSQAKRRAIVDDAEAAGARIDWQDGSPAETGWLFPEPAHNPRTPTQRIAIRHAPDQTVELKHEGVPAHPLNFDGVETNAAGTASVSVWRGLPLEDGDNRFDAEIRDRRGAIVGTLTRVVHYANRAASAVLVPEESVLVVDGLQRPVIAVRMLDRSGRPVRAGVSGAYRVNPPYLPAERIDEEQRRQLAGLDRAAPAWRVEGDDGIAYIELAPTGESGSVVLGFSFPQDADSVREQELRTWLAARPRDWVIVGFAAGTVGYNTLNGNMQALDEAGEEDGSYGDGQLSLYAKGRVLGEWLLTLAYDSDKPTGDRRQSLLSTIDPNEFYTLYGDGTAQHYDGASAEKLYLKLEREQFYALVGDYETGLTRTELSRYSRTLTGVKSEYHGDVVEFTAFASDTGQNFARDEIQGNGTSGLYRLTNGDIVINGEKIRIETRDRFRSEIIVSSRELLRHLDYDIDYAAGTLLFREPVASRDFDFNPIFIVAEYETAGTADEALNAGGRVGVTLLDGTLGVGASFIRDDGVAGRSDLGGVDATLRLTPATELRVEAAASDRDDGALSGDGSAWLAEIEHHGETLDALAYLRRQEADFGVNQQNGAEGGTMKAGIDAQLRFGEYLALQSQIYRQENLETGVTRDALIGGVEYRAGSWGARVGAQYAKDEADTGESAESRQLTIGASRLFLDEKLELTAQSELSLGGDNDSVDYPTRHQFGAAYALRDDIRLVAAHEITDGEAFDSSTTRLGVELLPWKGARLTSTMNQSEMSEYGPRTFAVLGLAQSFEIGDRWIVDMATDTSRTFDEAGTPLVVNEGHPIASGGVLGNGALTEDFFSFSGGATYRAELWSWTGRAETRDGETSDRHGIMTSFLRQAQAGVAFSAAAQAFRVEQSNGTEGLLVNASLSWAFRPLGRRWSVLDRLEFRLDELTGATGGGLFGATSLAVDARSRRLVNNLAINRLSRAWGAGETQGNLFEGDQRNQWSLYYGSKYVFDRFDGADYGGYTDILGGEWRYDVSRRFDLGLRGSLLHAWDADNYEYAVGPVIGYSPFDNAWFSLGYNLRGFDDRDFDSAHHTTQGPFLTMRFKFDQATRLPGMKPAGSAP